jgi:hypothetical protein
MLNIYCPTHESEVLVTERRIRQLRNTRLGIILDVECYCGTHVKVLTGRNRSAGKGTSAWNAALAS